MGRRTVASPAVGCRERIIAGVFAGADGDSGQLVECRAQLVLLVGQ
ncbi:hypothetical protein [Streptomyces sp. NPDC006875]